MADAVVLYASPEHLNSMADLAAFIAKHHPSISVAVISTVAAVPASFRDVPSVTYHSLPTPEFPPGSSLDFLERLFEIPRLNNPCLREALLEISEKSRIRAFVVDVFCDAAFEVSSGLGIPTYYCQTSGATGLAVMLYWPTVHENIPADMAEFDGFVQIPGCPPLHSSVLPELFQSRKSSIYKTFLGMARNSRKSAGILCLTFEALEFRAVEALANGLCVPEAPSPPVYHIGPLIGAAGGPGERHECLRWLDSQPERSVVLLCFGRRGVFSGRQLRDMAIGLEKSGHRFLWAVRNPPELRSADPELEALLPAGFLERTKGRGLVLKNWAPQTEVLAHGSVGGFVSHCGQNSILEAAANGVPIIGWPLYAEQKMNRVVLVEEVRLALPLEEEAGGFVAAAELEKRVRELMEGRAGTELRRRALEMKHSAAAALRTGGSSVAALGKFIESITCV